MMSDDTYRERHGDEPTDDASARHCDIKIDGLPGQLPPGEHRMTFEGMEYQPGGRPVLRFRYAEPLALQQAEDEGWLPAPAEVYRTKTGKIITGAMIEEWVAEAERGYEVPDLYQVSTTETLNVSRLARVIAALLARGVISERDLGVVPTDPERAAASIEDWLRS
jgi:hypothetical protein